MRSTKATILTTTIAALSALSSLAHAAEICGNGIDDDADNYADEGCGFANSTMGICESPMSCAETGDIDAVTGAWIYQLPADIAPTVPFGPKFEFRRTYMSMYAPPSTNYRTAMGNRWQHNFQSWLDVSGTAPNRVAIVHMPTGQDVRFQESSTPGDGFTYYNNFQAGAHFKHLRQATASPNAWELKMLTGEVLKYNWASPVGKLIEIQDTLATPNKISIAYLTSGGSNGQIDTVTDASGHKRFKFAYSQNRVSSVQYQTGSGSTWTTRVTLSASYTSSNPTTIQIGGTTIQTNTYTSNYLTSITDGDSKTLVNVNYVSATPGKVANVTTGNGSLGYDYSSAHAQCTGKTALFFNLANTSACNVDSDCGTGFRCGGKTGTGSTGKCYRAARCLTTTSQSENLITTVTAFTPCTGACAPVAQYSWNTSTLDLKGIKLADNFWTSYQRDANGMVITTSEGDSDDDATNVGGAKTWLFYGNSSFPGRVTEVRRQTDTSAGTNCSNSVTTHCKRTLFTWNGDGLLGTKQELGFTGQHLSTSAYSYTTTYTYGGGNGRLSLIDGPLSGANDVVEYTYWTSSDVFKDGYTNLIKRKKDASSYLTTTLDGYDYFGNAGSTQDPDSTFTCRTWDGNRNYLSQVREAMNAQTSCATTHASDLVTGYVRDTSLRLTRTTNPLGDCEHREYDSFGRLTNTKPRDDCNAASAGNTMSRSYTANGQLTQTESLDATGSVKKRETVTFLDGLQTAGQTNPVSPSYARTYDYLVDGSLTEVNFENGLGRTTFSRDAQNRETGRSRYIDAVFSRFWTLNYPASNATSTRTYEQVTDSAGKNVFTYIDDLGRRTTMVSPDSGTTVSAYDEASRMTSRIEAKDTVEQVMHTFLYDNLGRKTSEDSNKETCEGGNPIDVEYHYDSITCPGAATCTRTAGRLAHVKTFLLCTNSGATSIFQETYYGYDDAGRLISEYISDNTGRTAPQTYTWDKNGNVTAVKAPSNASMTYTLGGAGNSDTNLVTNLARSVGATATNVATGITWAPFGPVTQYDQENTVGGNKLRATLAWNLAYRATQIKYAATGADRTTINFYEDPKGRYIDKDYVNLLVQIGDDQLTYDNLDRITCEAGLGGACPTSPGQSFTNISSYNTSNDRESFIHSDSVFGYHQYTVNYNAGTDKIANLDSSTAGRAVFSWNLRGDRNSENNDNSTVDTRTYTYDGQRRVRTIDGRYKSGSDLAPYRITYAFDQRNRLVFRSWSNLAGSESQTFYYYDLMDRLIEIKLVWDVSDTSTYTIYNYYWLGARPVVQWLTAFPFNQTVRYYTHADEGNRILELYTWPDSGDSGLAWALQPDVFGWDSVESGANVYQPLRLNNMIVDDGTQAWKDASTPARPMLLISGGRHYDPMTGTEVQRRGEWPDEPYRTLMVMPKTRSMMATAGTPKQCQTCECGLNAPETAGSDLVLALSNTGTGPGGSLCPPSTAGMTRWECLKDCLYTLWLQTLVCLNPAESRFKSSFTCEFLVVMGFFHCAEMCARCTDSV